MKKVVALLPVVIFILSIVLYNVWLSDDTAGLNGYNWYYVIIALPIIGMVTAYLAKAYKYVGVVAFICNLGLFFYIAVFPFFMNLFWENRP